jgi:hypothetical protein
VRTNRSSSVLSSCRVQVLANTFADAVALLAGCGALLFVARVRRTYFLDSRFFIGTANVAFNVILAQDLISDLVQVPASELIFVAAIIATTISIGFASFLLGKTPELSGLSEVRSFLLRPPRAFLAYIGVIGIWGAAGLGLEPWSLQQTTNDSTIFYYSYEPWFLVLSSILLAVFLILPVANVYRRSRTLSDATAARSLRIISMSWTGFGIISLFQVAMPFIQTAGDILEGMLFVFVAFALREPTVLSRIISSHPSLERSKPAPRTKSKEEGSDQLTRRDSFSSALGLDHNLVGKCRMLLEFDPYASYEDLVRKFVEEFQSYGDSVAVFTNIGSPLRRRLIGEPGVNLFSFSSKTSTPSRRSDSEVLLPERESSLMLDAVDKLLQANKGHNVALVFDIFGELALLQGFEKAYTVLSSVLEMVESESATTLVLLNQTAHDSRVLSGVRGLFVSRILCDVSGTRLVRFQRSETHGDLFNDETGFGESQARGVGGN